MKILFSLFIASLFLPLISIQAEPKSQPKKGKKARKGQRVDKTATPPEYIGVHPLFALENISPADGGMLKIGGMCFVGDTLYVTALAPDRANKSPDKQGKILRLENVLSAGLGGDDVKVTVLCDWLYEPCAIAVVGGSIYVGEKDRIIRFDDGVNQDVLEKGEEVVLLDGASTANFHTCLLYTSPSPRDKRQSRMPSSA